MQTSEDRYQQLLEQYQFIMNATPGMIWTARPDGQLDYVNEWMVRYTGLAAVQLLGEGWYQVIHPEEREMAERVWRDTLREQVPNRLELRFLRADGTYHWHLRSVIPYYDGVGSVRKWVGVNTDINDQKLKEEALRDNLMLREAQQRLRQERDFSQSLLETSTDGILALSPSGHIAAWNRVLEEMTSRPRTTVLGRGIGELIAAEAHPELWQAVQRAFRGETALLYEQDGPLGARRGTYELIFIPFASQEHSATGVLGIVRDITERRKREEERIQARLLQQREVLNAVLHTQEQERERIAESLHNGLAQLLYAVKVNLQAYLYGSGQADTKNPALLAKVDSLLKEAILQSRLISEDLTPSVLRDFGLTAALEEWMNLLSTAALRITCQTLGLEQRMDAELELTIFRIVQALMGNVLLHEGASQAQVLVARKARGVTIVVEDNGKGFGKEEMNEQVKGIGLRSVKNRASLLNGKVSVDSRPGKGTAISVYLPFHG